MSVLFDVLEELDNRKITEARHFTTSNGLLGVLRMKRLLSRSAVRDEDITRLIALNNCYRRWDDQWFNHVSLSLQRINGYLYDISSTRWHAGDDLWWAVLGFDREVLAHPGVTFVTTNNGHRAARRAQGLVGLQALFAPEVEVWRGHPATIYRVAHADNQTTCPQAEALYPEGLDTADLRTIYVPSPDLADSVKGMLSVTNHHDVEVICDPEAFA